MDNGNVGELFCFVENCSLRFVVIVLEITWVARRVQIIVTGGDEGLCVLCFL
jgi:hypothetical protein